MSDFFNDLIRSFGPDKGFRIIIMTPDIVLDCRYQFRNASEYASANPFPSDLAKPAFDQVQPRRACRCEVQNETGMFFQPCRHVRVAVCSIIIQDHMNIQPLGHLLINLAQEFQKFNVSVSGITGADYFSFQDVKRCEKTCSAVAF